LLGVIIVGSVLAVGTVHTYTLLLVGLLSTLAGTLALFLYRKDAEEWPLTLPAGGILLLTLWTALQAIPLPASLVAILAPHNAETWRHALDPLGLPGPAWHPISLDPGATWVEVLKGITYLGVLLTSTVVAFRRGATFGVGLVFVSALAAGAFTIAHGIAGMTKVFGLYEPIYFSSPWQMGPLLNSNHLAGYLNLGVTCGLGTLLVRKPNVPRWLSGLGVATLIALAVLAASRGATVLLPLGVALVVLLLRSRNIPEQEAVSRRWLNILTFGAVAGGVTFTALGLTSRHWKALLDQDLGKLSILSWARPLVFDHPWLGIGRGAFETVYPAYRPIQGHVLWTHPENLLVQWAAEWGLPVTLLTVGFFAWLIRPSRMGATRSAVAAGAVAGIFILVLQNWVDFSLEMPGVAISAVALIGTCWGDTRRRGVARSLGHPWASRFGRRGLTVGFAVLGGLALLLVATRGMRTALDDRLEFRRLIEGPRMSKDRFNPLIRAAMLRHPAEPYIPLVGAERAWRERDANPIPYLQRVFTRAKVYGRAHLLLAEILFARHARHQALMELKFACRDEPALTTTAVGLAVHYKVLGKDLDRMIPEGDDGLIVMDTLAGWMHTRDPETSQRYDEELLKRDPARVGPRIRQVINRIHALKNAENPLCEGEAKRRACADQIEEHIAQIEKSEPDTSRAARLRADALMALHQPEKADKILAAACDHVKDRNECLRARVPIVVALGHESELETLLDAVAASGCSSPAACAQTHLWIGRTQLARKNLGAATSAFQRATRHDPRNVAAWTALGNTSSALGLHAQAARAYEQALVLDPQNEDLRKKLDKEKRDAALSISPSRPF
jgi:tetratricopeptide (TPR) repeat protein